VTTRRTAAALCSALLVSAVVLTGLVAVVSPAEAALPSQQQWASDVNRAMAGSRVYVRQRVATGAPRMAINLDIDNTSLASHYDYGRAVPVVLRLADYAEARGVTLLFNTGRVSGNGALLAAARDLRRAGYDVAEICGRRSSREGLAHSKQRCRQHFVDEGYTIIANVGNRSTDFYGGDYERAFRLPNYGNQLA
jgi:hypothetical protein